MIIWSFTLWQRWGRRKKAPRVNKLIIREAEEGRRRVKFAKLVTSGDQEEDFGEHSLFYTLTLNDVEAKYFSGELVTSSFTASNIPASNLPASDFPACIFPIDLVIVVWSLLTILCQIGPCSQLFPADYLC